MCLTMRFAAIMALTMLVGVVGCGTSTSPVEKEDVAAEAVANSDEAHSGWWCDEHGVPEERCALCDPKLVAEFKATGDWCKMHERPDSQCFVCHPEREAEFAAQYEAKYGKQPPKPNS